MDDNGGPRAKPPTLQVPPEGEALTAYDRAHLAAYIRLLDAEAAGADWRAASSEILAIDPQADPIGARRCYNAHVARAKWMTRTGYKLLVK